MTAKKPRIASLKPVVLAGNRRVTLEMVVDDLPDVFGNITLTMPDSASAQRPVGDPFEPAPARPPKPADNTPGPYPNVELSILNSRRQQIASLFIVEHKEKFTALTLHLSNPDLQENYSARAEMTYQDEIIDAVEVPFTLNPVP